MRRLFVCDELHVITADLEVCGSALATALEHEDADDVIRCAILMALSVLVEGGEWPTAAMESMGRFMTQMKAGVASAHLM